MIKGVLVINNYGKPRMIKFYEHYVRFWCFFSKQRQCFMFVELTKSFKNNSLWMNNKELFEKYSI